MVAIIYAAKLPVEKEISASEIDVFLYNKIAMNYVLDASNIDPTLIYSTSGIMKGSISKDVSQADLEEAIKAFLSESLNLHPHNIHV
jgi:hypothetical protein